VGLEKEGNDWSSRLGEKRKEKKNKIVISRLLV